MIITFQCNASAHLHFALTKSGAFIDPMTFQRLPGLPVPARHRAAWNRELKERLSYLLLTVPVPPPVPVGKKPPPPVEEHDPIGLEN